MGYTGSGISSMHCLMMSHIYVCIFILMRLYDIVVLKECVSRCLARLFLAPLSALFRVARDVIGAGNGVNSGASIQ